jgi:hypothetical protein
MISSSNSRYINPSELEALGAKGKLIARFVQAHGINLIERKTGDELAVSTIGHWSFSCYASDLLVETGGQDGLPAERRLISSVPATNGKSHLQAFCDMVANSGQVTIVQKNTPVHGGLNSSQLRFVYDERSCDMVPV